MQSRIQSLENAQESTVESLIKKVTHYGMRRDEDFDKYEALALAERLLMRAQADKHPKATAFDIIVNTLRTKMQVSREQFKAYYLALLAEKEYAGILDSMTKVDKLFKKKSQPSQSKPSSGPPSRTITCWHCGRPGHRIAQCFRLRASANNGGSSSRWQPYKRNRSPPSFSSTTKKE